MTPAAAASLLAERFPQALVRCAKIVAANEDNPHPWQEQSFWFHRQHALEHLVSMVLPGPATEPDPDHAAVRMLMCVQTLYGHQTSPTKGDDHTSSGPPANAAA